MKTNFTMTKTAILVLAVMLVAGCKKPAETKVPVVTILENSVTVGQNTATLVGEVVDDGGATITERGFCYGKSGEAYDTVLCAEGFSLELTGLTQTTTYTCKAFASNEAGRGFSEPFSFTTASDSIPMVKTWYVREVTHNSAVASGQVVSNGGQTVIERGICYSTEPVPTVSNLHVASGSGVGSYDCPLTDLMPETVYYVRAYAVCTKGTYYGSQVQFCTEELPMEVHTLGISEVTATRAKGEGDVIRDGGFEVTERGFCWGTEHNPTIEGLHIKVSLGVGYFHCHFSGFERGVTHYVRAYAVNEEGVVYGEELEFVPDDSFGTWPEGASPKLFSVAPDRQVRFSQGNLQYNPSAFVWRFAERQWDYVGGVTQDELYGEMDMGSVYANGAKCDNRYSYGNYNAWMDLFCWATSGWDNGNVYYLPYDYAGENHNFFGPPSGFDLTGEYAESDWGVHNIISNGASRQWRTPTADEFNYLLMERVTPSGIRFAKGIVAGVKGLIILPDDWDASVYYLLGVNVNSLYTRNEISAADWLDMLEPAGAVFLPAAGHMWAYYWGNGTTEKFYENSASMSSECSGTYWTVSHVEDHSDEAYDFAFWGSYSDGFIGYGSRCVGRSVRLISDER